MSERTEVSFDAALMMALRTDAQKELDELPTPAQLKDCLLYTSCPARRHRLSVPAHKAVHSSVSWAFSCSAADCKIPSRPFRSCSSASGVAPSMPDVYKRQPIYTLKEISCVSYWNNEI